MQCTFDLGEAEAPAAPAFLVALQNAYEERLNAGGEGTDHIEFFAILRHIVSLIYGDNRGLEGFRRVVAASSSAKRVDVPIPYEPDGELLSFEETDVISRSHVLQAAGWLVENWPQRFIDCCREAEVGHSALHRKGVRSYCEVAALAATGTGR
jgi:hypothetical protein